MTQPAGLHVERIPERSRNPHRMGRHVAHDVKSIRYAAAVLPKSALRSVRWERHADIWDQGDVSCCVADTAGAWLVTDNAVRTGITRVADAVIDQAYIRDVLYKLITGLDEFPGQWPTEDTGSSGIAGAKALKSLGLCSSYQHAFTVQAALSALQAGPVMAGTSWLNSMFDPAAAGRLTVDASSGTAGGHEYLVDEYDADRQRVWIQNSWGSGWGIAGRAWLTVDDWAALLTEQGDVTVPAAAAIIDPPAPPAGCVPGAISRLLRRSTR